MQPTPAQHAIKQSAVAGGITALATIAGGTYQYVLGHGLNIPALLLFLAPFVTGQALTLWHTLRSLPQFPQALTDTVLDLPQEIKALPSLVNSLMASQHTHQAAPTVQDGLRALATPAPSATSTPAQVIPPAPIPQRPFPGQLNWTAAVPTVNP